MTVTVEKDISIVRCIVIMIKELIKFSLLAVIVLLTITLSSSYVISKLTMSTNIETVAIFVSIITAAIIVAIDTNVTHYHDKITECVLVVIDKIVHRTKNVK